MWETVRKNQRPSESRYFLDWMDQDVLTEARLSEARSLIADASSRAPSIHELEKTPQGAPWHTEGPVVMRHIERILCGLLAVVDGSSLVDLEELARHKSLAAELQEMEETIREHAATLQAYALLHDLGKAQTVSFEAPEHSKGATEGFFQHEKRVQKKASEQERQLYLKLARAHMAVRGVSPERAMATFFDEYEIRTHFTGHAKVSVSSVFEPEREAVCDLLRLTQHERRMLTFCIQHHITTIGYFNRRTNPKKIEVLKARANKVGLDADDVLDLLVAAIFLDTGVGSLHYAEGAFAADLRPTINFLLSQAEALPERRLARQDVANQKRRKALKALLRDAKLEPDVVFSLMELPHGPERGAVMEKIYHLVSHPDEPIDLGRFTNDLAPRIIKARAGFDPAVHLVRE